MKKRLISVMLSIVMIVSIMGSTVFAETADASASGIYALQVEAGVTVVPMTENKTAIESKKVLIDGAEQMEYENAQRFQVTVSDTEDQKYYLIMVIEGDGAPTESNMKYIDQKTSDGDNLVFDVFPSELVSGKTYHIALSDNGGVTEGLTNVASFKYYAGSYMLGDIDMDGEITATDAMMALQYSVDAIELSDQEFLAGDVDKDGEITATDAMLILQYSVDIISEFE